MMDSLQFERREQFQHGARHLDQGLDREHVARRGHDQRQIAPELRE